MSALSTSGTFGDRLQSRSRDLRIPFGTKGKVGHREAIGELSILALHSLLVAIHYPRLRQCFVQHQCFFLVQVESVQGEHLFGRLADHRDGGPLSVCRPHPARSSYWHSARHGLGVERSEGERPQILQPLFRQLGSFERETLGKAGKLRCLVDLLFSPLRILSRRLHDCLVESHSAVPTALRISSSCRMMPKPSSTSRFSVAVRLPVFIADARELLPELPVEELDDFVGSAMDWNVLRLVPANHHSIP